MTAMLVERTDDVARHLEPVPGRLRPRQRRGDGLRPRATPVRPPAVPRGVRGATAHACLAEPPIDTAPRASTWRLTDRGLAVAMVLVTMIALAAVTVVGLTAFRVTSPSYQPYGQSALQR